MYLADKTTAYFYDTLKKDFVWPRARLNFLENLRHLRGSGKFLTQTKKERGTVSQYCKVIEHK